MAALLKLSLILALSIWQVSIAKTLPPQQLEDIQLQIYLDQQHFGPGILDGKPGRYTRMAIEAYNHKHGYEAQDQTAVRLSAKEQVPHIFALATVPNLATNFVDPETPLDSQKELQAKVKQLSYRSIAEFMAERYHTTEDILIELNGSAKVKNLKVHSPLYVPNVNPFLIENMKNGKGYKSDTDLSRRWVVVDTQRNQLRIFDARFEHLSKDQADKTPPKALIVEDDYTPWDESKAKLIAAFPITPGKTESTHYGEWKIKNAIEFPGWRYDKSLLKTGVRSKEYLDIPAGPNNPVGVLWMGLTKSGIGIHGTNSPRTIGRAISSGCIRMSNWDVVHVPKYARPGSTVIIK